MNLALREGRTETARELLDDCESTHRREIRPMRERIERGGDDRPGRGRGEGGGSAAREASS